MTVHSHSNSTTPSRPSRRRLLRAATLATLPLIGASRVIAASPAPRNLVFEHTHTGEALSLDWHPGAWMPAALERIRWFLRDFRSGETHAIDPLLIDQLATLAAVTATSAPFQVISGYRSVSTNEALRRRGGSASGVASHSLHIEGRAIDIRLADVRLDDLRDAAISLKAGGVGFYPDAQFVHIDTGRMRRW
ncbi:MAG TPA: DUF882 domain-containing protein [Casimicrobiaceae bacterium]|nr:DUF882 domain-containing protein [Casimicrobiaceae bacterium]